MSQTPIDIPFQLLLDALLDVDTPFLARYLYRLSDLDSQDLASLRKVWPSIPAWRRRALLQDVEELGGKDTLLSFEALARFAVADEDPQVRLPAVRALWEFEHRSLASLFLGLLGTDPDEQVRAAAAAGLGRFVYAGELEEIPAGLLHEIEERLLQVLAGGEPLSIRRSALEALGYSGRGEVEGLIEEAYRSGNKEWMASALMAMGRSADERWEPQVIAMLESNHPALRSEAARAAGELEIREALPRLRELLEDPDPATRRASIWSLSQIGGQGVRAALEKLYENAEEDELDFIEMALDNLSFTEDMQLMPILEFEPQGSDADDEDVEIDLDDLADLDNLDGLDLYDEEDEEEDEFEDAEE